jgi:hypothetical protein
MTARKLIAALKKMPPNALVGFACPDNREYEIQGWACSVQLCRQSDFADMDLPEWDTDLLESHPKTWIAVRC